MTFVLMCCGVFVGCKENDNPDSNENVQGQTQVEVPTLDTYLIKNGYTPYKVVLPQEMSTDLEAARNELLYFFELSTGITLDVISEAEVGDVKGKYLSLGETKIAKAAGVDYSKNTVGRDGYCVKTYGDAIVMVGGTDRATVFSVYGYLKMQFHLEIYTETVFTYDETVLDKVIDVDVIDTPDIPFRAGTTYLAYRGTDYAKYRYRMSESEHTVWGTWAHTFFRAVPPEQYANAHPEYYNAEKTQLALENEETPQIFADFLINEIEKNGPEIEFYNLSFEDNWAKFYYDEAKYMELEKKYGGTKSSVYMWYLNKVVKIVNAWLSENHPDWDIKFYGAAYQQTQEPPVKWDEDTQSWVVYHEDLILEPNLGIQWAPVTVETASQPYSDSEHNPQSAKHWAGWKAICSTMTVWDYSIDFYNGISPFNSYYVFKQNYTDYKEAGVEFIYAQSAESWKNPQFEQLRQYLMSTLAWDTSLDTETLIVNFFKAYYQEGWEYMYEYFHLLYDRTLELETSLFNDGAGYKPNTSGYGGAYPTGIQQPDNLPYLLLKRCDDLVDLALEAVDKANNKEARLAIRTDRITLRYLILNMYRNYYDSATYLAMVREFEDIAAEIGFVKIAEQVDALTVAQLVQNWIAQAEEE